MYLFDELKYVQTKMSGIMYVHAFDYKLGCVRITISPSYACAYVCMRVCVNLEEVGYGGEQPQGDGAERFLARAGRVDHLASVHVEGEDSLFCSDGEREQKAKWVTCPCLMCMWRVRVGCGCVAVQ